MHYLTETVITSSECAKLKHVGLAKYAIKNYCCHVTFSQSGGGFIVAESF